MNKATSLLLVGSISVLLYLNTLGAGFVFDDHRAILTNDDLDSKKTSIYELFSHDFWGGGMHRKESHKSYRPLTVITYRLLNYEFAGLEPFGYHLVNVILHAIVSMLFLQVAEIVLGPHGDKEWSTMAALLFATHSIHTEAVASVVGRAELLACIFFLFSFLFYSQAINTHSNYSSAYTFLSIILGFFSMLSKEQGITVLGVCGAYDVLAHWNSLLNMCCKIFKKGKERFEIQSDCRDVIKRLCFIALSGAIMMWFRISMNEGTDPIFKPEEMRAAFHPNRLVRIFSFSNIYVWNILLLIFPSSLCCDWSLGSLPIIETLYDVRNIWSLILYIVLGLLIISTLRGDTVVGIGMSFLLIPFLPSAGIIFKVGFVIAERVLYLPSLGYCLLLSVGAERLSKRIYNKKIVQIALVFVLISMSVKTVSRNWDWHSDLSLFESGVRANPGNVKLHNNYAMELKSAGRFKEAEKYYKIAMEIEPDYAEVYFNYGNLLSETKDHKGALHYFEKAMSFPHMYSKTLNNAATMYFKLGRYTEAENKFKESLEINPDQPMTYNNLASLYGETKRYKESSRMFKKAIEMNPGYTEAYFNYGTLLYQMGQVDEGEKHLRHALKLNPNHHGALNNLKVIEYYRNKGQK
ncbi:PREDICTED: transmembrane and TPR repeat-containing protein 1-like [Amphimedon queenslandica]|nr:PREDICTED: transmembrane and TPR repeat-containing protein 1-like [Amphimedon queenslandica]|eukprot:XP_019850995.1 PREDICTED: transmembrane and TPR repeat-containing protein 1-like [Amphimedon queenslandica]